MTTGSRLPDRRAAGRVVRGAEFRLTAPIQNGALYKYDSTDLVRSSTLPTVTSAKR